MERSANPVLSTLLLLVCLCVSAVATAEVKSGRVVEVEAEAEVTGIDLDTRQVTLQLESGESITVTAPEAVITLEEMSVGDIVHAAYIAGVAGEVREPTEEELAEPWEVLEEAAIGEVDGQPAAGSARVVRAVCTVEGMNRLLGTATLMDPNGNVHVIGDVDPAKMEGVTLGQTVVVEFEEALAVTLEPVAKTDTATE